MPVALSLLAAAALSAEAPAEPIASAEEAPEAPAPVALAVLKVGASSLKS